MLYLGFGIHNKTEFHIREHFPFSMKLQQPWWVECKIRVVLWNVKTYIQLNSGGKNINILYCAALGDEVSDTDGVGEMAQNVRKHSSFMGNSTLRIYGAKLL